MPVLGAGGPPCPHDGFAPRMIFDTLYAPARPRLAQPRLALVLAGAAAAMPGWLHRLEAQRMAHGLRPAEGGLGVVLLPRDRPMPAAALPGSLPFALRMARPGETWREGLLAAAEWVGPAGAVLVAEAERLPEPGWLAAHAGALTAGAPAVAGRVRSAEPGWDYAGLLDAIAARLDPAGDAAPMAGAAGTLALRAGLLGTAMPLPGPEGLLAGLQARDVPVRQADAMVTGPAALPALERLGPACRRLRARAALRRLWTGGVGSAAPENAALRRLARRLGLPAGALAAMLRARHFGTAWAAVEDASPALALRPLPPGALAAERVRARLLLRALSLWPQRAGGVPAGICIC